MTATTATRAQGTWTRSEETSDFHGVTETVRVHTFRAQSGFTAAMRRPNPAKRNEPYTASVTSPEGRQAEWDSQNGYRCNSMTMHLNLAEAKLTVEENVHRAEQLALRQHAQQRQTAGPTTP